jgi:endonuclease-3
LNPLTPEEIIALLAEQYGELPRRPKRPPVDELVLVVLSQNTSDVNSERAFARLRAAFPDWRDVIESNVDAIEEAIRPGGLGPTKALRLKAILSEIAQRRARTGARLGGSFDLSFLATLSLDEAKGWLESLPGIGPKSAAVTLLFSLDRPAFPVDTHVHRVLRRLGLIPAKASATQAQSIMEPQLLPNEVYAFHMWLIVHGRRTCVARRPRCPSCNLQCRCPSASMFYPSGSAVAAQ